MNRTYLWCLLILLCLPSSQAATLGFAPAASTVLPGDQVSVSLIAGGLGATVLGDFDVTVSYDPAFLTVTAVTPGLVLGDVGAGEVLDFSLGPVGAGLWNIALVSLLSSASLPPLQTATPLVLATLAFTIGSLPSSASTSVSIANVSALGDSAGTAISVDALATAQFTGAGSSAIPEPGSAIAGLGLVVFAVRLILCRGAVS